MTLYAVLLHLTATLINAFVVGAAIIAICDALRQAREGWRP